jgi:molybdopterin synthase sulfur carrier subunit
MDRHDPPADGQSATAAAATIRVLYFAGLKEALGSASEDFELPQGVHTVAALRERLRSRGGAWEKVLAASRAVRVAVNQEIAGPESRIAPGDEVAFFPPVTGG